VKESSLHHLLLWTGLILTLVGIFFPGNVDLDLHFHDTYIVIQGIHLIWFFNFILVFVWMACMLSRKIIYSGKLSWVHIVLTIGSILTIVAVSLWPSFSGQGFAGMPRRYYDYSDASIFQLLGLFQQVIVIAVLVFVVAQLIFLVNLGWGLLNRRQH
jgi:cytochrome c oxidase subunit 1